MSRRRGERAFRERLLSVVALVSATAALCAVFAFVFAVPAPMPASDGALAAGQAAGEATGRQVGTAQEPMAADEAEGPETDFANITLADGSDNPAVCEPGVLLATLAEGTTEGEALAAITAIPSLQGVSIVENIDGLLKLALPESVSVESATKLVENARGIEAAQPNYRYYALADEGGLAGTSGSAMAAQQAAAQPSTASFPAGGDLSAASLAGALGPQGLGAQAALDDPYYDDQWYLSSVKAPSAWKHAAAQGTTQTTVAVIDAGFLVSHEDLKGSIIAAYDATTGEKSIEPDNPNPSQLNHGTHCAGVIAAATNNGLGVAGLANNACKVLPIRVENSGGILYSSYVVKAYSYLVKKKDAYNVRVANMSLGASASSPVTRATDKALYDAIQKARDAGIVTVVAACNDSQGTPPYRAFPSDFDNVISVIALSRTGGNADGLVRASYSNYNVKGQHAKNISAPGTYILSTLGNENRSDYKYWGEMYGALDGTSMAAPVVAGAMGLMFAVNPKLSVNEATSKLYSSATDLTKSAGAAKGWDRATGFGEVDAAAAVSSSQPYLSGATKVAVGKPKTLAVRVAGVKQSASGYTWISGDESIARVDAHGKVTGVKAGQVIITAKKGSQKLRQLVTVCVPADKLSVTFAKPSVTYTGKAQRLTPKVSFGGKRLKEGQDYTVTKYSNCVDVGKVTVTITGIAPYYSGTKKATYKITKAPLSQAKVKLSATSLDYNGKARKPVVTVYDIGKNKKVKLKQGVDYTVSGKGVVRGKGELKIAATKSCANFKGSVTRTFVVS